MTLKYMQGFESMRDDSDFRVQNWVNGPTPRKAAFVPSSTSLAGFGLTTIGTFPSSATVVGATGASDVGYFNTGVTINQAWTAGGFTMGCSAKFNGGVAASYAVGQTSNSNQACFDGTRYWAIRLVGATYNIAFSTDLVNWTIAAAQPAIQLWGQSTISYVGGGMIVVLSNNTTTPTVIAYYTSNQGASWSTQTIFTGSNAQNGGSGVAIATGNGTYPHAIICTNAASSAIAAGGVYVGTIGGTMTQVVAVTAANFSSYCRPRAIGSLLVMPLCVGYTIYSATAANASLNTTGAWSTATLSAFTFNMSDIAYHPTSNLWVIAANNGIQTIPNTGSPGTPVALTGTVTATQRYSTVAMQNVYLVGSTLVAVGFQGHIITSPDGVTWTEAGAHILPVGTSGTDWRAVINDGSRYVLFSDATNGVIATTPDLQTNYAAQYVMENTESASNYTSRLGVYGCSGAFGSTFTQTNQATNYGNGYGITCGAATTTRTLTFWHGNNSGSAFQAFTTNVTVPGSTLTHYYEFKLTKDPATVNNFFMSLYIDGSLAGSNATSQPFGNSTADTTSLIVLNFARSGQWTQFDDIYFTLDDTVANTAQGPLGPINIVSRRPTTDVSDQWVKNGAAASNSLSVNQPAFSSQTANFVSSANAGDKDSYTSTDTIPAGYTPKAVLLEGVFTRTSSTAPTVNVGILSGSTESDSSGTSLSTSNPTYVSQLFEHDPNGNIQWTSANIVAAKTVLNHTT